MFISYEIKLLLLESYKNEPNFNKDTLLLFEY